MAAPENEHIFGIQLRESADDGSDFTNADADYRKLFLGEDGFLHVKDSSGTVTDPYDTSPSGGTPSGIVRVVSGDISVTSTSAGASMGISDITLPAVAGDIIEIGLVTRTTTGDTNRSQRMDVATIVSSAPVNYVSSLNGTPATAGITSWFQPNSTTVLLNRGSPILYEAQAGDIDGGSIVLRLCAWLSGAGTVVNAAQAAAPLVFWAKNLGQ